VTGLVRALGVGAKQRETAIAGAVVAGRSQAHSSLDGGVPGRGDVERRVGLDERGRGNSAQ
jgi:hypothetical protein